MKRFLLSLVTFIVPIVIVSFLLEMAVRTVPNSYTYKDNYMKSHHNVQTLIIGSSNMYAGINPNCLEHGFNLANSSQRLEYDWFLLSKYKNNFDSLKTIILGIDVMNLYAPDYESGTSDWNRAIFYHIYMDCPKHKWYSKYAWEISCNEMFQKKVNAFFSHLMNGQYEEPCDSLGMGTYYKSENSNDLDMTEEYSKYLLQIVDYNYEEKNLEYLNQIISFCEKNNVELILITTPCWSTFRDQSLDSFAQLDKTITDLTNNSKTVHYYNYLADNRFIREDFYNVNHLSDIGAIKFTEILKEEVLK